MSANPIRILVVDDDAALLAVLESGLRTQHDYAVAAVTSGQQALTCIERADYDLVVTDYALNDPRVNGLTVLKAVRRRNEKTLVIIITAYASLEITLESIHLGAHDFLTKPFQMDELLLVVRNAADRIRLERENDALRRRIEQLIASLDEMQRQQGDLTERLRTMSEEGEDGTNPGAPALAGASLAELRRRRMRDQLGSYVRMGETIRERLNRERENIEVLFQNGILSEEVYRRALEERRTEGNK